MNFILALRVADSYRQEFLTIYYNNWTLLFQSIIKLGILHSERCRNRLDTNENFVRNAYVAYLSKTANKDGIALSLDFAENALLP